MKLTNSILALPLHVANMNSALCFAFFVDSIAVLISFIVGKSSKPIKSLGDSVKTAFGISGISIP